MCLAGFSGLEVGGVILRRLEIALIAGTSHAGKLQILDVVSLVPAGRRKAPVRGQDDVPLLIRVEDMSDGFIWRRGTVYEEADVDFDRTAHLFVPASRLGEVQRPIQRFFVHQHPHLIRRR